MCERYPDSCRSDTIHKTLCVFTINYPFAIGEEFFESEIVFLKDYFDDIVIFTQNAKDKQTRHIPMNAKVVRIPPRKFPRNLRLHMILGKEMVREAVECFLRKPYRKVLDRAAALVKFVSYGNLIDEALESFGLSSDDGLHRVYLYSYWFTAATLGMVQYKKKHPNVTAIARVHRFDLYEDRDSGRYFPMRQTCATGLDAIFAISEHGASYLKQRVRNTEHIRLSRLGTKNPGSRNHPSDDGIFRIVSCSSLVPIKRLDLLIDALARINRIKILWTHIGTGKEKEQITASAMVKLGSKNNIAYQFIGHLDNQNVYAYYTDKSVDCFINVSDSEGLPVSMMEAASFGIPIIARNVGGVGEIVDETNGILLSTDASPWEIADAVEKIASMDAAERQCKRDGSYKMWERLYSAENNYQNFVQEILSLKRESHDIRSI
jgi:glycosyltransferase involved in cell wall biosynthesis